MERPLVEEQESDIRDVLGQDASDFQLLEEVDKRFLVIKDSIMQV